MVACDWRPGYGAWRGWVPAECAVDAAGECVAVLRRYWRLAHPDRAAAERLLADSLRREACGGAA